MNPPEGDRQHVEPAPPSNWDHVGPLAPAPPPQEPNAALWFYYLFLRPRVFFQHFVLEPVPILTVLAAWVLGTAGALDHQAE